jgi:dolichyl-phosphate-mannose-protein mannosyltransferase
MEAERPPIAWGSLVLVAGAILALHALCLTQYGWFRDELYYLSCSHRLAWGYVDQPPLSIALLALIRFFAGPSLVAFRLASSALLALACVTAGLVARQLGGRRFAQTLAALAFGVSPLALACGHFYSMNALDIVFWPLVTLLALRAFDGPTAGGWIALGVALGLGLLNKWSVLWLGAGIAAYLVLSRRDLLRTPGPWLAAAIAGLLFAPNVVWEVRTGWPTVEFMHHARAEKMVALQPLLYLANQGLTLGPGAAPIWIAGLVVALTRRAWRAVATIYVVTLAILLASGSARVEYITLPCVALFGAGAAWWEGRGRLARALVTALALLLAIPIAPFALPILPVTRFIAYQAALGRKPATEERHAMGSLPQQYADMFGWPEFADSVARVCSTLTPEERRRAIVIVDNYGEAGALERFGQGRVPRIACQHNNWYFWGPPAWDGGVAILVRRDSLDARQEFDQVKLTGLAGHPLAMPYEQDLPILIARGFHADLKKAWAEGKHFE